MTLVDNNGREITAEELCASLAADLRGYRPPRSRRGAGSGTRASCGDGS